MSIATFHGFIETTADTLLIFEACRRGLLPKINRRLQDRERGSIRSGTVFVFDEKESGIKRWTDGLVWSPSRILGNFLIYRELENRETHHARNERRRSEGEIERDNEDEDETSTAAVAATSVIDRNRERALVGSLTNSYKFKQNGLIKKTMSIVLNGSSQHLISYYTKEDVLAHRLQTPSSIPALASLPIAPDLLLRQSFRIPPTLEQSSDPFEKGRRRRNTSIEDQTVDLPRKSSRNSWDETCAQHGSSSSSAMMLCTGSGDNATWLQARQMTPYPPTYDNRLHKNDSSNNRNNNPLVNASSFATTSVAMDLPTIPTTTSGTLPVPLSREAYYAPHKGPELAENHFHHHQQQQQQPPPPPKSAHSYPMTTVLYDPITTVLKYRTQNPTHDELSHPTHKRD
ncbi:hypothetical protein EC973_003962 [Apophysomyces ossiformis]|uniref:Gti1/Pac2 family-domain-containing protein n=1 Tax=Apophysomyces ossiformis TaxID=679940 RepID=A0A8H7EM11_9FUNG|nr:hypothetical protein EC973_003962 [Apophysomyces ossiformis]